VKTGVAAFLAMAGTLVLIPIQHLVLDLPPLATWLVDLGILLGFLVVVGLASKGRWDGVLVDERNKLSLSRLQTILWSILVIGSMIAFAFIRLRAKVDDPLNISVPEELLIAIGITTTALVGSPLIRSVKEQPDKTPNRDQAEATIQKLGLGNAPQLRGLIVVNPQPSQATWIDMIRGEEGGNAAALDVGKIQMFWFTGLLVVAYLVMISTQLPVDYGKDAVGTALSGLPELSAAFIGLLAISNGTYLTNKAVPHTAT
jgi:hypothetical protein